MRKLLMFGLFAVFFLSACGQTDGDVKREPLPLEVELIVPERADVNEEVVFTSVVTQGDEGVEDASEVVYEIWKEGEKEESEMIEANEQEGHHYHLTYTFAEEGVYFVQTHVTARGLHTMPTAQIVVGDIEAPAKTDDEEAEHHEHEHEHHH